MKDNREYQIKLMSALAKVFPGQEPEEDPCCTGFTMLRGETFSFVAAYTCGGGDGGRGNFDAVVRVESPAAEYCRIREIVPVPSLRPVNSCADSNYLRTQPGMYPDLLTEPAGGRITFTPGQFKSLWIDVEIPENGPYGDIPVAVVFASPEEEELCRRETSIKVYRTVLGPPRLLRTEWFHGDCLADYYQVPVFSEEHWRIMESFISAAAARGCNMILTPQFTPPLDTAPGGERTTIQLVGVKVLPGGGYEFDFSRLERWVAMCLSCGMTCFEMSHLFTQWGAGHPPKIMAEEKGKEIKLFGWDDPAVGGRYTIFLEAYLPRLTEKLRELGIARITRFHISDEPEPQHLLSYKQARESVAPYLKDFVIMDAISSLAVCREGEIDCPVCSNDHMEPFLEAGVTPLWSYYCTAQDYLVSNRFMAMPSARCRIYGAQVFKYGMEGILHWGYNFYNSQYSLKTLDPYRSTDADGAFPSGDSFLVYPGADGKPEESIRMMVLCHTMQDVRAMEQLADKKGREYVVDMLEEDLGEPITFKRYPKSDYWILQMRNRINRELDED